MDDQLALVQCESCGENFEMPASTYEKIIEMNQDVLCIECFDKIVKEQYTRNTIERRKFEYAESDTTDLDFLNEMGQDGWELVQITYNKAYFKREIVKGLE